MGVVEDGKELFVVLEMKKEYYSVQEVAEILHISMATVQSYITNGIIAANRINGRRMVSREALCKRLSELGRIWVYDFRVEETNA